MNEDNALTCISQGERNEWGHMAFPKILIIANSVQLDKDGPLPVSLMIHLNSTYIVQKNLTLHEIS